MKGKTPLSLGPTRLRVARREGGGVHVFLLAASSEQRESLGHPAPRLPPPGHAALAHRGDSVPASSAREEGGSFLAVLGLAPLRIASRVRWTSEMLRRQLGGDCSTES